MIKICDAMIPKGGAMFPDDGTIRTIFQVVSATAEMRRNKIYAKRI